MHSPDLHISHRRASSSPRPSPFSALVASVQVLFHRRRLDSMLADGADPTEAPELALRARQLLSWSHRRALADSFEQIVAVAERRGHRASAAPPLASREVRACRAALLGLAGALREEAIAGASGVVLAERLLTDGSGPLYIESVNDALWRAVRKATWELEGPAQPAKR